MKKILFLCIAICVLSGSMHAVSIFLDFARFQSVDAKPYMEVYITIDGTSVNVRKAADGNGYQSKVELEVRLLRLEEDGDTTLTYADKYNLLSPVMQDTNMEARKSFPDLKRIMAKPGLYALRVIARDVYGDTKTDHLTVVEIAEAKPESTTLSDIEFVASVKPSTTSSVFTKHKKDIVPFGLEGVFINQDSLNFYFELYNTDKTFTENYFIQAALYKGEQQMFQHTVTKKKAPSSMDLFYGGFEINKLPPSLGEAYSIRIKLFNSNKKDFPELVERVYIYTEDMLTHQPVANTGSLFENFSDEQIRFYIQTLTYLTESEDEIRMAKSLRTPEERKNYLAGFWEKRALASEKSIGLLWETHRFSVKHSNENYKSAFRDGWQTDRGRVFITYGPPSDIERFPNERNALPYELWKYDKLGTQAQVVFIFLDQDRSTNSYSLIHSTKYGELQNPTWRSDLLQPTNSNQGARLNDLRNGGGSRVDYEADSRERTIIRN